MDQQVTTVWRLWVDPRARVVSFHPEEGFELLEFYDHEMFLRCVDEYTRLWYRYQ